MGTTGMMDRLCARAAIVMANICDAAAAASITTLAVSRDLCAFISVLRVRLSIAWTRFYESAARSATKSILRNLAAGMCCEPFFDLLDDFLVVARAGKIQGALGLV